MGGDAQDKLPGSRRADGVTLNSPSPPAPKIRDLPHVSSWMGISNIFKLLYYSLPLVRHSQHVADSSLAHCALKGSMFPRSGTLMTAREIGTLILAMPSMLSTRTYILCYAAWQFCVAASNGSTVVPCFRLQSHTAGCTVLLQSAFVIWEFSKSRLRTSFQRLYQRSRPRDGQLSILLSWSSDSSQLSPGEIVRQLSITLSQLRQTALDPP